MRPPTKGRVLKKRVWCFVEALLTRAEDSPDFEVHWETDKNTDKPNFVVKTKRRFLESLAQLKKQELTEVIKSLENLQIWDDRRLRRGQGSEIGSFALKLWSTDAQRNWEQFERVWEASRTAKSKALETTYNKPKDSAEASEDEFDWQHICLAMLEKQKRLTTNELLSADEDMKFELDDIHVPLALVQRTKPDKRGGDVSPEEGSRLLQPTYEEKQRFRHEEFLAQVIQEGKGQSKGRRIAVIGEPGAGKTTLLQSIAFWLFEDKNKNLGLPIWISLADLQGKTLEEYLLQRWLKNALEVARVTPEQENVLLELFKKERVWLLLDGVDEIAGDSVSVGAKAFVPLQMVASQLEGWVAKARVVLSCRLNVWEANINALGDNFQTYRLLDFDYPLQVKEFICRWFRKTGADKGERLWTELDKSERQRIQDLVKNPLRLALLCSTWQSSDKGLPSTKAGLYQQFLTEFYKWKENRFPTTEDQQEELNAALGRLAKQAIGQEASRFRLRHQLVREELGDPKQQGSLFWLALQLGWLNQVGLAAESETQEKVYAFFHPTFQEYFAALAVEDWDFFLPRAHNNDHPKPVSDRYRIFEPQWKEVILLWLGREEVAKEQKEEFIKALVEFDDGCGDDNFYWCRAYFLAATSVAEFSEFSRADEIMQEIIRWSFGYFDAEQQKCVKFLGEDGARRALQEADRTRAIDALTNLLYTSQAENIRMEAARSLAKIAPGSSDAIKVLIDLLHTSQDRDTCLDAISSLGEIGTDNEDAIHALIKVLHTMQDDDSIMHCMEAARSLGKIAAANQDVINTLIDVLSTIQDDFIGWDAARSLGKIAATNQDVINVLTDLLHATENERTCLYIAFSLGQINSENQEAINILVNLLNTSQDEELPWVAARCLEKICVSNQDTINNLIELLYPTQRIETLELVAEILGVIAPDNSDAIKALIELLRTSPEKAVRVSAAESLGKIAIGNLDAINALIELLGTIQDESLRLQAAWSLGKIHPGNPVAINVIVDLLHTSRDESTCMHIAARLGQIAPENQEATITLIHLLSTSQDGKIRVYAPGYLQQMLRGNLFSVAVAGLKDCLTEQIKQSEFDLYYRCYEVLWHCAENMTYPAFYQAWHQQEEVGKTTTPNSQSLNQADLPQSLQGAIANDPQLSQIIHLICIDRSQFIEPDRPAAEIYDQMLDQNCPECDRVPETMHALKLYWNSLKRKTDKRVVLVFYASSTNSTPDEGTTMSCPYSSAFLTVLSKFGREICAIAEQRFEHIPLKFFAPSQSIEDIVQWIRAIVLLYGKINLPKSLPPWTDVPPQ